MTNNFYMTITFQSTLSMRRATGHEFIYLRRTDVISIHALHEESDQLAQATAQGDYEFQSTLSMRRATCRACYRREKRVISIHALHEESDG